MNCKTNKTIFLTMEEHRQIELEAQKNGLDLMDLAAQAITDYVEQLQFLKKKTVLVIVGKGNNGGDGVSCAIKLKKLGYFVTIFPVFDKSSQNTTTLIAKYTQLNGTIITELPADLSIFEVIIDAVIGIGISSGLDNKICQIFDNVNATDTYVLAVDTPSGMDPFTGKVHPGAIKANTTLTFVGDKPGLHTGDAVSYAGNVIVYPLI